LAFLSDPSSIAALTSVAAGFTGGVGKTNGADYGETTAGYNYTYKLTFTTDPSDSYANQPFARQPVVTIQYYYGGTATGLSDNVTLALSNNAGAGGLIGTTTVAASSGVATFTNVGVNMPGDLYTLTASATGITSATSAHSYFPSERLRCAIRPGL
jgi:hypothetical protein